jgi:hypothetical protein
MSSDTAEPVPSDMESNRSRSPSKFAPRDLGMDLELVSSGAGSGRGDAVCKLSVPPLKILGEGVDPGEVGAGEAMRVSRVDSNVTSRSRDASVCSDRSIESCEEGVRERTPSKDGSCASTEESRGNASQNRYVVGLSRPSPCTASSPRGSSPRGPRGGISAGAASSPRGMGQKTSSLPLMPTASFPPPSPRNMPPPPSPRNAPPASPRRTLTQHRDLIEAQKRTESLEEALARWRKENTRLSADIRLLIQAKAPHDPTDSSGDTPLATQSQTLRADSLDHISVESFETANSSSELQCGDAGGAVPVRGCCAEGCGAAAPRELEPCHVEVEHMIARGAGGVLYEGRWYGARVAVKELEVVSNDAIRCDSIHVSQTVRALQGCCTLLARLAG